MSGSEPIQKKVDESWKSQVEKDRGMQSESRNQAASPGRGGKEAAESDFSLFVSSLSMQAMVALGELPHPGTTRREADLEQGRYLIDMIGMLQQKTKGNLTAEEATLLESLLYELRMKYVSRTKQ